MMFRKVTQLRKGDVILVSHDRYKGYSRFKVSEETTRTTDGSVKVKLSTDIEENGSFGPTVLFRSEDMVQVTPE